MIVAQAQLLELGEQPAVRRTERDVAAVHRRQVQRVLVLAPGLDPQLDQPIMRNEILPRHRDDLLDGVGQPDLVGVEHA